IRKLRFFAYFCLALAASPTFLEAPLGGLLYADARQTATDRIPAKQVPRSAGARRLAQQSAAAPPHNLASTLKTATNLLF
ncbi:hypothetical protein QT899_22465, partial [Xanthomonas citri pv. citri]